MLCGGEPGEPRERQSPSASYIATSASTTALRTSADVLLNASTSPGRMSGATLRSDAADMRATTPPTHRTGAAETFVFLTVPNSERLETTGAFVKRSRGASSQRRDTRSAMSVDDAVQRVAGAERHLGIALYALGVLKRVKYRPPGSAAGACGANASGEHRGDRAA